LTLLSWQWPARAFVPAWLNWVDDGSARILYSRKHSQKGDAMSFAGISYLAVLIAAVAAWLSSAAWYMSLSRHYVAALGKTAEQMAADRKKPGAFLPFLYAFVANIIIAWMLAGLLGHLGPGQVTLRNAVISALFLWFGLILTTMGVNYSFAGRDRRLLLIDGGNWLLVLLVIGAVIGAIGV
jgi:Protein of unknown function (DUF1761)